MAELKILRGIPGSGKSTMAIKWVAAGDNRLRVNRDDIRLSLFGEYWGPKVDEDLVTQVEHASVRQGLRAGFDVVDDATNLNKEFVKKLIKIGVEERANISFVDFNIPVEEAIRNDFMRDRTVGRAVIERFYNKNTQGGCLKPPPAIPELPPTFAPYVADTSKPTAFIFDIDGTLANHEGVRNPYDPTRYHLDKLHVDVADVLLGLQEQGNVIIIVSGRDEEYESETLRWLHKHDIYPDELWMRPTEKGQKTEDSIVKLRLFDEHIRDRYNVLGIFDDRNRVVDAWRSVGLRVYHVQEGDF